MGQWVMAIQDWVVSIAGHPLSYVVTSLLCWIDGFFPPLPSESVIIAMSSLSAAGAHVSVLVLVAAAYIGGFLGDQTAYWMGRKVPLEKLFRGRHGTKVLDTARHLLHHKGPSVLISGRYIPGYRVAINMVAGTVRLPYKRFVLIDAASTLLWVLFTVGIGLLSGHLIKDHPLLGIVVGIVLGGALGFVIERILTWWDKRSDAHMAAAATEGGTSEQESR